ncbi:hypothetical protein PACTADRAFT_51948 [Pachysolen tannophilus NRRL Y-2460]|uniref:Replication protein A subunit n=1 Tax=Pachysolen tannophilus NRRL Y-2460 TaxID=669874 RepID=A0A1E4TNN3_PACTA|nr:hypothetical protein PACTADRAFT_51948 [Pachysolen tannophilus NRRL Y-2460]
MMAAPVAIDDKVLHTIFSKSKPFAENHPVTLQVTNIKQVPNDQGKRLRLIISDGSYTVHGVIRPEFVDAAEAQGLKKSSIVTLLDYDSEKMSNNKRVLIISELKVVQPTAPRYGQGSTTNIDDYFNEHPEEDFFVGEGVDDQSKPALPVQSVQQQQVPVQKRPESRANIYAIDQLSPYQNNWTIKARVSYKSDMRTWSNQKGEGKLFNVNLLDETNEIRATAFNDIADKFYDLLQEGKVYYISKARIQQAKPQFSNLSHPYELSLDRDTEIEECEDAADVPKLNFNFVKLNKIQDLEANAVIDVVGVLKEVNPAFQIVAKSTGRPFDRRDIVIVDESHFAITVGLWNKSAIDFNLNEGSIVVIKGAKVQDFGGRSLSLTPSATIVSNPDIPEAFQLKGWYDKQGIHEQFKSLKVETMSSAGGINLNERKTILEAQNENLGMNDKADYFSIKASINFIRTENFCYPACSTEGCNRKVLEQPDGSWRCEKCDKSFETPNYRYILTISVIDHSGQLWLTLFNNEVESLLDGTTANEIMENNGDSATFFQKLQMNEFNFRIRARQDNYNGNVRVRYQCVGLEKVKFSEECDHLVEILNVLLP